MNSSFFFEVIGYIGSILVAISLTMKSLFRLRLINFFGALFFILYGFLIGAFPIVFLNGIILCVNVYNLYQMLNQKDYFKLMEVAHNSIYLKHFLEFYREDIIEFFPSYLFKPKDDQLVVFVLRNMVPAGLLIAKPSGEEAEVFLDFVIPGYRDLRAGRFLFEESADYFRQKGIRRFVSAAGNLKHESYLKRMGFVKGNEMYIREIQQRIIHEQTL